MTVTATSRIAARDLHFKSYGVTTQGIGAGTFYAAGFYDAANADANLNQGSTTQTHSAANVSHASHAFLVAGGAGSVDAGSCSIVVSGISVNDQGTRTTGDSETIVADITAMTTDAYYETEKKWLGQITYTLTPSGAATYSADFNYGLAKYEDFGNRAFIVTDFEVVGLAGANDSNFDVTLLFHNATGWTYNATAFVPGATAICQLSTDHSTDDNLDNGDPFAYKRDNLSQSVNGADSEGVVVQFVTTAVNAVEFADMHIGVTI